MNNKKVYVIEVFKSNHADYFDFRKAEHSADYDAIKNEAIKRESCYDLEYFQDCINDETLSLNNAFILID